jgi:hypothetical protein
MQKIEHLLRNWQKLRVARLCTIHVALVKSEKERERYVSFSAMAADLVRLQITKDVTLVRPESANT